MAVSLLQEFNKNVIASSDDISTSILADIFNETHLDGWNK